MIEHCKFIAIIRLETTVRMDHCQVGNAHSDDQMIKTAPQ